MLKRSALTRRTPLRSSSRLSSGKPLARHTKLAPLNRRRRARMHALQFGVQAQLCRMLPCLVRGCTESPSDPHHEPTRARGGLDENTCPLCRTHHDERHDKGLKQFNRKHGVDLIAETIRLRKAMEHAA